MSGTAIAVHGVNPRIVVTVGACGRRRRLPAASRAASVEPMDSPQTIADGLRSTVSERTLGAMRAHLAAIATCSEGAIVAAMRMVWERAKIVVEPSSAVPLAAMLEGTLDVRGKRVGVVITGGNVDLTTFLGRRSTPPSRSGGGAAWLSAIRRAPAPTRSPRAGVKTPGAAAITSLVRRNSRRRRNRRRARPLP